MDDSLITNGDPGDGLNGVDFGPENNPPNLVGGDYVSLSNATGYNSTDQNAIASVFRDGPPSNDSVLTTGAQSGKPVDSNFSIGGFLSGLSSAVKQTAKIENQVISALSKPQTRKNTPGTNNLAPLLFGRALLFYIAS